MHRSVLLKESIEGLAIKELDTVVDGTFGGGGHTRAILDRFGKHIFLICVDLDEDASSRFQESFANYGNAVFVHANFKDAPYILEKAGKNTAHRVLLDLGTSTFQLLADTRGFSFNSDTPLSMTFSRYGSHTGFTAYDIVNTWQESSIADIIYHYGEEKKARLIAKAIVTARKDAPITSSLKLSDIISRAVRVRGKTHPATKTFQALRIAVNDELQVLSLALDAWWQALAPEGRIAIITFHSLEDRIVKRWIRSDSDSQKRVITKKPIVPSRSELLANPRARSAKLRIVEKVKQQ